METVFIELVAYIVAQLSQITYIIIALCCFLRYYLATSMINWVKIVKWGYWCLANQKFTLSLIIENKTQLKGFLLTYSIVILEDGEAHESPPLNSWRHLLENRRNSSFLWLAKRVQRPWELTLRRTVHSRLWVLLKVGLIECCAKKLF